MSSLFLPGKKTVITTRFWHVFKASMFSMLSAYLLILTDNITAGHLVGEQAVMGVTLVFPLVTFIIFMSYIIADGLAMKLSYAQGRGDRQQVDRLFSMGIILACAVGIVFTGGMYFFRETILSFWQISPQLLDYARDYYEGLYLYAPFTFVNVFLYTVFVAEGQAQVCVQGAVCTFVVNFILDILLCIKIGVIGVGIATTCGLAVAVLVQIYYLRGSRSRLHFSWYWNIKEVLGGIWYSCYHSLDTLLLALLPVALTSCVLTHFGEEHIIVVTVVVNLLTLIIALYTGIVDCLQPMVCQYHAEQNLHSIQKTMGIGIKTTVGISLLITLLAMALAEVLPLVFGVKDAVMVHETGAAIRCFLLFTVFLGSTLMYSNYYIYIEKRNYGAFLKIMLLLGLPYIGMECGAAYSFYGLWLGTGAAFLAAFVLNYLLAGRQGWLFLDKAQFSRQYSYDINSVKEEVMGTVRQMEEVLTARNIPSFRRMLLMLCIEEIGLHAAERAAGKNFQLEISLLLGREVTDKITLIVRDNGQPYDILKAVQEGRYSFREYFIDSVTTRLSYCRYLASGDENRLMLEI
ncbi:MAG: polysaccharide biosynthesis C-terminal domain-containing protein [Selenomonas sp.]|nr:polysaccharide biosynthesis C-terminal domain-containing protein [Selenomonas sp.]